MTDKQNPPPIPVLPPSTPLPDRMQDSLKAIDKSVDSGTSAEHQYPPSSRSAAGVSQECLGEQRPETSEMAMADALDGLGARITSEAAIPKPRWFLPTVLIEPVPVDFSWHIIPGPGPALFSLHIGKIKDRAQLHRDPHGAGWKATSTFEGETIDRDWTRFRMAKIAAEEYFHQRLEEAIGNKVKVQKRTLPSVYVAMAHQLKDADPRGWVVAQLLLAHPQMTRREAEVLTEDELAKASKP